LSAVFAIVSESERQARNAEVAHLDAVLKVNGAKALRLSHLVETLRTQQPELAKNIELKLAVGDEPQVWLDMAHRITMEPNTRTYRLAEMSSDKIDVALETENLDEALLAAQRVLTHGKVRRGWDSGESAGNAKLWSVATLVYVWATGFVAGAAALALIAIYLKKFGF
jgi:hypothetical protein